MLTIRPDQVEVLRREHRRGIARELAPRMRESYEDACHGLDGPALVEAIDAAMVRGMSYGCATDAEVRRYVALELQAGCALDAWPDVQQLLASGSNVRQKLILAADWLGLD